MAEIWAVGLATLAVGAYGANQAGKAGKAANKGQQSSIDEQRAAREQAQRNAQPYMDFGNQSIGQLSALNSGDYSGWEDSPDFLAAQKFGTLALDNGATRNGNLWGGGADADRIALGQGLATQYLGNYRNALQFGTSIGQAAAAGDSANALASAGNIGGAYSQMGVNSGNAALGQANAWGSAMQGLGTLAGQYYGQRQSSYAGGG